MILKKNETLEELKNLKYNDLEDLVSRIQLTHGDIRDILDLKYFSTKPTVYSLNPGIYEVSDINKTLEHSLPDNLEVSVTFDDIRLKSNLKKNQTSIFAKRFFFYSILGFTQSHSYPWDDIEGFYQLIARSYRSNKPINITGVDKVHQKTNCVKGSIVDAIENQFYTHLV